MNEPSAATDVEPPTTPEEERWLDWTSRPYQFVPLNLYDETQKLSEIAVGEMLERLREAERLLERYSDATYRDTRRFLEGS